MTEIQHIYRGRNFSIIQEFIDASGNVTSLPSEDFVLTYSIKGIGGEYVASRTGTAYKNCEMTDAGLKVYFDSHKLQSGTLQVKVRIMVNGSYPDTVENGVEPYVLGIELWDTTSDIFTEAKAEALLPFITGKTPQLSVGEVTTGTSAVEIVDDGLDEDGNPKKKLNFAVPIFDDPNKVDKTVIKQETGNGETFLMSQKAVTDYTDTSIANAIASSDLLGLSNAGFRMTLPAKPTQMSVIIEIKLVGDEIPTNINNIGYFFGRSLALYCGFFGGNTITGGYYPGSDRKDRFATNIYNAVYSYEEGLSCLWSDLSKLILSNSEFAELTTNVFEYYGHPNVVVGDILIIGRALTMDEVCRCYDNPRYLKNEALCFFPKELFTKNSIYDVVSKQKIITSKEGTIV